MVVELALEEDGSPALEPYGRPREGAKVVGEGAKVVGILEVLEVELAIVVEVAIEQDGSLWEGSTVVGILPICHGYDQMVFGPRPSPKKIQN
ncbi:unnamed protein product [Sphagnum troendelagicum]|jgi:hypothetical protein|uniref:Uncharacterized protein n=1 Tax=Sphagnum jensenii TaxID=128206 RepID=A0ABP0WVT5_9BRYO